jgi:hypothetical protein
MKPGLLYILLTIITLQSCIAPKPFYNSKEKNWADKKLPDVAVQYTIYLVSEPDGRGTSNTILPALYSDIKKDDTSHAVVFFEGLSPASEFKKNDEPRTAQEGIENKFSYLQNDKGKIFFLLNPAASPSAGRELKNYLDKKTDSKNIFVTELECPDAEAITITKDLVVMPINNVPPDLNKSRCELDNETEWLNEIKDLVDNNQRKNILILGYYPVLSMGNHGGHFSLKEHIFPLTDFRKSLYVPLPVLGTVYLALRSGIGFRGDFGYPSYKSFRKKFLKTVYGYNNIVYASGHERNFQYFKYNKQDYLITNSGPGTSWVARNNSAYFTDEATGYVKLTYLKNGEVWAEFIAVDAAENKGTVVYRKQLKDHVYVDPHDSTAITSSAQIKDSTIVIAPDRSLKAGSFKKFFLGKHYRDEWVTPVRIPVLDLRTEHGGLTIIKKGGGFQTKSLKLQNKSGEEFSLRSVNKYPERLLGNVMLHTFAADLVKDQVSSTHPYSPYVVDDLSEAAGILHSNPKMVYIPNDVLLAEYKADFANTIALFEQRADGKMRPAENFGYSRESVSSSKMLSSLHEDNANAVDDFTFLKSRLFDMWINDWDRHENQWRWGEIACDSSNRARCEKLKATGKFYVPIPKDRDQAFAKFDGVIPWLAGRKWVVRKFQDFQDDIRDVPGLNFNARNIDHALLTELSKKEWLSIANELKEELTDKKIEHAIRQFPDTIYKLDGQMIISKLKSRRDKLPSIALRYYNYLAKNVDVLGSDKNEYFEVQRLSDDSTAVNVYDNTEIKRRLIYSRTFFTSETNEVRLYGLDGDDLFKISGHVRKSILIRIIGGKGNDTIVDESDVRGLRKKTIVYDDRKENVVKAGKETKDMRSGSKSINDYDFYANNYNVLAPATFFEYTKEDGLSIGGGVMVKYNSFRKAPYANYQRLVASVALKEVSFKFKYTGDFNNVFNKWGVNISAAVVAPKATVYFFGLGNDSKRLDVSDNYYRLRYDEINLFPALKKHMGKYHTIKAGPVYDYIRILNEPGTFITSSESAVYRPDYTSHHYIGGKLEYEYQHIDDSVLTFRGVRWMISSTSRYDLMKSAYESTNIEGKICVYIPVGNRSTLAMRAGGATQAGDFRYYYANTLGGQNIKKETGNLRGSLRERYSGRSVAYLNSDLRIKLFGFRTYLFPAHFGVLAFYDVGRVWADDEKSTTLHRGYGGGVWMDPFGLAVINFTYAVSSEEKLLTVGIGFLF